MHFAQANILYALWLVLALIFFLRGAQKHRQNVLHRFAQEHLAAELTADYSKKRQRVKHVLLTGVFIFSILALARPQWGFEWQDVKRRGIDILVVVDTSKSMLTQDVRPNRLDRTKLAVMDLVKKLEGDRIGLVAFAGDAFLACPLTADYPGFLLSLNDLDVDAVPRGGTNIAKAVEAALKSFEDIPSRYQSVIIVTDGDNLEGDPLAMAKKAGEKGVKIFTIGIGTREGELIQVLNSEGEKEFLKDARGNFVKSRLNERLLQEIALTTGGIYVRAGGTQFGLDLIYERELAKLEKREIEAKRRKKYFERFQIPLALAFLFLMIETCLTTRRKIR